MTTTDNGHTEIAPRLSHTNMAAYGANLTRRVGGDPAVTEKLVRQLENDSLAHALNATGYVLDAADDATQTLFDELEKAILAVPTTMRMVNRDRVLEVIRRHRPHPRVRA